MQTFDYFPKFAIVIPTYNAGANWFACLDAIVQQKLQPDCLLIIDSSSHDATVKITEKHACRIITISQEEFGHGKTRQYSLEFLYGVEFVIFLTQDAILSDGDSIVHLLGEFRDKNISAIYGRQIARSKAGIIEKFERKFNYPLQSLHKSTHDSPIYGLKTTFISNSFAAYRLSALKEVGGFPEHTILAEDMYVGAKMLQAGWKIAYCAEATVYHSHNYSVLQTFQRYFDTGVFHAREPWIRESFGGADSEGLKFVRAEFVHLLKNNFTLIPLAILKNLSKYVGFKIGLVEKYLPVPLKRKLSMHKAFW